MRIDFVDRQVPVVQAQLAPALFRLGLRLAIGEELAVHVALMGSALPVDR